MKRGQVYLLAVIILAFVIYTLYTETNTIQEAIVEDDFEQLTLNYERESAKLINYLLANNIKNSNDIQDYFTMFTTTFTAYSKTKNPNFGLLYLFDYQNNLYIGNYLEEDVDVEHEGTSSNDIKGCLQQIPAGFKLAGTTIYLGIGRETDPELQNVITSNNRCIKKLSISTNNNYPITITIHEEDTTQSTYEATITKGKPDVVIVSRETKGMTRKVYTKGRFIKTLNLE